MKRNSRAFTAALGTLVILGVFFVPITSASADADIAATTAEDQLPKELRLIIPFEHAVAFEDAIKVTIAIGLPVAAYRYENPDVVGEYSLASDQTPMQFLGTFQDYYGTSPQVVSVVVMQDKEAPTSAAKAQANLPTDALEFAAAPVADDSKAQRALEEARKRGANAPVPGGETARSDSSATSALSATTWHPDQADVQIYDAGSNGVYFSQYYSWVSLDTSPYRVPDHFGLEFQVDIYSDAVGYQGGSRPFCAAGYKSRPFASNETNSWNWSMFVGTPTGLSQGSGFWGAYPDYNDSADPCNKNSMAIGIADPWALPLNGYTYDVQVNILAPKGLDSSGRIGGQVQAVSRHWCEWYPRMTFTDCMGVYPSSWPGPEEQSRITLGEWRNWQAPNKCWITIGSGDPQTYIC